MKTNKLKSLITGLSLAIGVTLINPCASYAAWKQDSYGWWNTEGSTYSTGWRNIDSTWYNFGTDGYMKTGWINDNGTWYYLDNSGAMKTGWVNSNGTWYYTNQSGAMQTGFLTLNDKTYYLNESGAMVTGDITLNGVKYSFAQTGERISSAQTTGATVTAVESQNSTSSDNSSTSSGGSGSSSGGGSGSSSSSQNNAAKFEGYSDLYGTWTITSHIENSGMKDTSAAAITAFAENKDVTVNKDSISTKFGTATNVSTSEKVLTNSEFKEKYGTDISKLGLSGDKVNCITISADGKQADIIVSSDNKVVGIANDTPFKLEKK